MPSRYVRYPALSSFASLSLVGSISGGIVTISADPNTATYNLVLPPAQGGVGTTLINDGSGNLSWGAGGGSAITALTGDGTATGPGSVPFTLATVNANVGSFGSATQVAQLTVNAKGLTTAAANVSIQISESQVTNLVADLASKAPLSGPTFTGPVSINGFTAGSVLFITGSGTISQSNANFFYDLSNTRLGVGTASPQNKLHINTGTATAGGLQLTAGTTTGTGSTDGSRIGLSTAGVLEVRNYENLATIVYNNNIETIRFTSANSTVIGTDLSLADMSVSRDADIAGGVRIAQAITPTITDTGGSGTYYGLAVQPNFTGSDNSASAAGAFFSINSDQSGDGGMLSGLALNASYGGSGTIDDVRGGDFTVAATTGSVNGNIFTVSIADPGYDVLDRSQSLRIEGTWGVDEAGDASTTGTQNAYSLLSSNTYFTNVGGVTLNGLVGGRSGKRALLQFASGATINNNSGSAAAGNKIFTSTGSNITITGRGCIEVVWSEHDNGWNVISQQP